MISKFQVVILMSLYLLQVYSVLSM